MSARGLKISVDIGEILTEVYRFQQACYRQMGAVDENNAIPAGLSSTGLAYPVPSLDSLINRLGAVLGLVERKWNQGITEFLLVPWGLRLKDGFFSATSQAARSGKLRGNPDYVSSVYDQAETDLKYGPASQTKAEILQANPEAAWRLYLVEPRLDVLWRGEAEANAQGGRLPLEGGKTAAEYQSQLASSDVYLGEDFWDPETYAARSLVLANQGQVLNRATATLLCGAKFSSGKAPYAGWYSGNRKVDWRAADAGNRNGGLAARSRVRLY